MLTKFSLVAFVVFSVSAAGAQDEPVFSGPQPGEELPAFEMTGVYDDDAAKPLKPVEKVAEKPSLLIFVHERTRPSFGLTNALLRFAETRKEQELAVAVCLLTADPTETEKWLNQVRKNLPVSKDLLIGISPDGIEGPGAYGLNRNVAMTILVADKGKVTSSFALVQPSIEADGPKVMKAVVEITGGGEVPEISRFANPGRMERRPGAPEGAGNQQDPRLRPLLRQVIRLDATKEEVDAAAEELVKFLNENPEIKIQVGDIANRIIDAGKLEDYGTPHAQTFLKQWAKEFKAAEK